MERNSVEKAVGADFYRELHKIADKAEPHIRNQILGVFDKLSDEASLRKLSTALASNNIEEVYSILGLTPNMTGTSKLQTHMASILARQRALFEEAADLVLDTVMPKTIQSAMRFDMLNQNAIEAIRTIGANLVVGISESTKAGLKELIQRSFEEGVPPKVLAERIKFYVGLTPRQMNAVLNYKNTLLSEGTKPAVVARRTNAYWRRQLRYRARTIARTETIRASNAGQLALWQQASEKGLIDEGRARKKWVVTPDDDTCHICKPIPRRNTNVSLRENFLTMAGSVSAPPAHPNCRCAMSLSFRG